MAKHLALPAVRRTPQHRRHAVRLAMSAGTAVLAVYAAGIGHMVTRPSFTISRPPAHGLFFSDVFH